MTHSIVSVSWLNDHLNDADIVILDASPAANKSGLTNEFKNQQLPGARYFDLKNTFSNQNASFPNTMPSVEQFEKGCQLLGINQTSKIVVYDTHGIYASPRVWWMFKVMGHDQVAVLDGGLPEWVKQGYDVEPTISQSLKTGNFQAKPLLNKVKSHDFVKSNLESQSYAIIDARSVGRFNGTVEEPRKGLRSGHIPYSLNLPFQEVLKDGKLKSVKELADIFNQLNIKGKALIFTCGSGLTACIILLASEQVQKNETYVYDGSWTEWAQLEKE